MYALEYFLSNENIQIFVVQLEYQNICCPTRLSKYFWSDWNIKIFVVQLDYQNIFDLTGISNEEEKQASLLSAHCVTVLLTRCVDWFDLMSALHNVCILNPYGLFVHSLIHYMLLLYKIVGPTRISKYFRSN